MNRVRGHREWVGQLGIKVDDALTFRSKLACRIRPIEATAIRAVAYRPEADASTCFLV
jgi:hypothetical protein